MSKYHFKTSSIYYKNTNIPKNKLNIKDKAILDEIEYKLIEQSYKIFTSTLTKDTILDEDYFINLHKKTFESLYDFAGIYRNVNMSKEDSQFCLAMYLQSESKRIFTELKNENYLTNIKDINLFAKKLAYYQCELIALHPFYELNGRIIRLYIDILALFNGYKPIDYTHAVKNNLYITASKECVQFANCELLEKIISQGLSKI